MSKGIPVTLAGRIFDGVYALSEVEDSLDGQFWPELVDHVGHDHYDQSIEIYFVKAAPPDLVINSEQAAQILNWGFWRGWLNFADGTVQHFWSWDAETQTKGIFVDERRKTKNPLWFGEKEGES